MPTLVRAELFKIRSLRSSLLMLASALGLVLLAVIALAHEATRGNGADEVRARDVLTGTAGGTLALLTFGVVLMTGEIRHGTIVPDLLVAPRRAALVVSKAIAAAIVGLLTGLLTTAIGAAVAVTLLRGHGIPIDLLAAENRTILIGAPLASALWPAVGVAIGAILRNQVAALAISLLWVTLLDNVIPQLIHRSERWLLTGAAANLSGSASAAHPLTGGLLFLGYAALLAAVGSAVLSSSDVK